MNHLARAGGNGVPIPRPFFYGKILRVIDGDTLRCLVDTWFNTSITIDVRLEGVSAPEIRTLDANEKAEGYKCKHFVEAFFNKFGPEVIIETGKGRSFNRWVGVVYSDGDNVNEYINRWLKQVKGALSE